MQEQLKRDGRETNTKSAKCSDEGTSATLRVEYDGGGKSVCREKGGKRRELQKNAGRRGVVDNQRRKAMEAEDERGGR